MKRKVFALLVATIMVATMITPAFANMPFADVPKDHWAYDSVAELAAAGLIIGYPDGTFKGERQFTRYEMAMVFARVLGRLDTLIAAEVGAEVKAGVQGLEDEIYSKVAQALVEEMAKVKAELAAAVEDEVAKIELPAPEIVERVVVEQPIEKVMPFELTDEAKAVIASVAADAVADNVAKLEPKVVEKIIEAEPEITAKDLAGLLGAVATAQTTADLNAEEIAALKADVAAARALLDELAFQVEVKDAVLRVTGLKADMANEKADAAQKTADTATKQALAALQAAEDAGAAADAANAAIAEANQEIRNLALAIAALEGDVNAVAALLESTTAAMEMEIAALSEEFGAELASLGVRVADLENIVADHGARIDLLEWEVRQLDEATAANAAEIEGLKAADQELADDIAYLETEQTLTSAMLKIVDREQQATAAEFAAFKEDHEKVKLSGSTETVFENIGIVLGDPDAEWPEDDDGDWYVYRDPRDRDDDEIYQRSSKLQQKFTLNLEAVPADDVIVKATLASTANVLGDADDEKTAFNLSDIALELETNKALRSLYVGERDEADIAARYNEFIINQEPGDHEVVAANVVLGALDTEFQVFRPWDWTLTIQYLLSMVRWSTLHTS
ncbi:MAG: S-layer homology domain-containing protein [Limnochordia bacterium]